MNAQRPLPACALDPASRERFRSGSASSSERRAILRHLAAGCAECAAALRPAISILRPQEPSPLPVSRILRNLAETQRLLQDERAEAAELWADFRRHPVPRQWTLLRNSRRFSLAAFAEILVDASYEAIYDDPRRSQDLAEMALHVVDAVESGGASAHGAAALHDLRGRTLSRLANSLRANSDLLAAEQTIHRAGEELALGSGEPLAEAELLYFTASIHRARRRFDAARSSVRRSIRIYREICDAHLEGRSLLNLAVIDELDGDLPAAIASIEQAIPKIDESRDRHLALGARHNLLWCLTAAGRAEEASRALADLRPRYEAVGDRMSLVLLRWMEGRIALQLGRPEAAEAALRESHEAFLERGIPYEAAIIAFDLAGLFARQGRLGELKALASELVRVFRDLGVAREAHAALLLFERAAQAEAVTVTLAAKLARWFENARRGPAGAFDAGDAD